MSVTAILLLALNAAPAIRVVLRLLGIGTQALPAIQAGGELVSSMIELLQVLQRKELTEDEKRICAEAQARAHARPFDMW